MKPTLLSLAVLMVWTSSVDGQAPRVISYQGYLAQSGSPLNGSYNLTFALYSTASGGTTLWTETQSGVLIQNGIFDVVLGGVIPFGELAFSAPLYLGVKVGSGAEMIPRTRLNSVPSAMALTVPSHITGEFTTPSKGLLTVTNTATDGYNFVLDVSTQSPLGVGVHAIALNSTGMGIAVAGDARGPQGTGVSGSASHTSGQNFGVWGVSQSTAGYGVLGQVGASTGVNFGVFGESFSSSGYGGYFRGGSGAYTRSSSDGGYDLILGGSGNTSAGDDGIIASDPQYPGSDIWLRSNDAVVVELDHDGSESGNFEIHDQDAQAVFSVQESGYTRIYSDSGTDPHLYLHEAQNGDYARIRMRNNTNTNYWDVAAGGTSNDRFNFYRLGVGDIMSIRATRRVGINNTEPGYPLHVGVDGSTGNGAHVTTGGTWVNGSSRAFKDEIEAVDAAAVLEGVAALPIATWRYKNSNEGNHMGPMAEDFARTFGLGADARYLATVDVDGVALAAIQELNRLIRLLQERTALQESEIERLRVEIATLRSRIP